MGEGSTVFLRRECAACSADAGEHQRFNLLDSARRQYSLQQGRNTHEILLNCPARLPGFSFSLRGQLKRSDAGQHKRSAAHQNGHPDQPEPDIYSLLRSIGKTYIGTNAAIDLDQPDHAIQSSPLAPPRGACGRTRIGGSPCIWRLCRQQSCIVGNC